MTSFCPPGKGRNKGVITVSIMLSKLFFFSLFQGRLHRSSPLTCLSLVQQRVDKPTVLQRLHLPSSPQRCSRLPKISLYPTVLTHILLRHGNCVYSADYMRGLIFLIYLFYCPSINQEKKNPVLKSVTGVLSRWCPVTNKKISLVYCSKLLNNFKTEISMTFIFFQQRTSQQSLHENHFINLSLPLSFFEFYQ